MLFLIVLTSATFTFGLVVGIVVFYLAPYLAPAGVQARAKVLITRLRPGGRSQGLRSAPGEADTSQPGPIERIFLALAPAFIAAAATVIGAGLHLAATSPSSSVVPTRTPSVPSPPSVLPGTAGRPDVTEPPPTSRPSPDPSKRGCWCVSGTPDSNFHCDNPPTLLYGAHVQECVIVNTSKGGAWVQGLLIVSNEGPSTQVLDGINEAWASNSGTAPFGSGDCGAGTFPPHSRLWCWTATSPQLVSSGKTVWARGYVKNSQQTARAIPTSPSVTIP
jgi:hypothetical protein